MIPVTDLYEKTLTLGRNDFLKVKGSVDTNIYYVVSGSLRVYVLDDFEEHVIRFGYRDNLIVSLDSFLTEQPSDFYIQAIKKTVLKVITKKRFMEFLDRDENNKRLWREILEELVLQQMEREKDILTSSPKERYLRVLRRSPQLFQEIPNRHIANYLRMSPETLSRLKKS
jgi:CRP-like cAMP-binding protein